MLDDTWFSGACCAAGCACACFERFAHDDGACVCGHARSLHAPAPRSPRPRTPAYVYLRPTLGLCNRLRALASAMVLAEDLARVSGEPCRVVVDWRPARACGCELGDLFDAAASGLLLAADARTTVEAVAAAEALDALETAAAAGKGSREAARRFGRAARTAGCCRCVGDGSHGATRGEERIESFDDPYYSYECLFVEAMTFFYPKDGERLGGGGAGSDEPPALRALEADRSRCLSRLVPVDAVAARVLRPAPGRKSVGVHVRRTDNHFAVMHSPLALFHEALEARGDRSVFLATDDAALEAAFAGRWRAATAPKRTAVDGVANRTCSLGVQDALVDVLSLAACDEVLGSYWSSFSRVAALWRDRPLTVVFRPYADVDAAAREAGAVAFGLLERGPHEAPDLDMNRAMLKITSKMLDDGARATDVDDDPAVIRELLRALRKTAEGGGKLTAA